MWENVPMRLREYQCYRCGHFPCACSMAVPGTRPYPHTDTNERPLHDLASILYGAQLAMNEPKILAHKFSVHNRAPAGGTSEGVGIKIRWDDTSGGGAARNGATPEDVLRCALEWVEFHAGLEGRGGCRGCREAISAIEIAIQALEYVEPPEAEE